MTYTYDKEVDILIIPVLDKAYTQSAAAGNLTIIYYLTEEREITSIEILNASQSVPYLVKHAFLESLNEGQK